MLSIVRKKKIDLAVIDLPRLDTRRGKDLIGTIVADPVLQVLSLVAQTKRKNTLERQAQFIAAAKARGVKFGGPEVPAPENFPEIVQELERGKITARQALKLSGLSMGTYYRYRHQPENPAPDGH